MTAIPLKRLASVRVSNVDKKSVEGDVPVRLCNYTDVYYRDVISPDQEFMSATASPAQVTAFRLRSGDILITKDSETPDDIGVAAFVAKGADDLICGYHLAILRPRWEELDGRFLYWFMASQVAREQLSVAATGITRFGLRTESLGAVLVPMCSLERQRAIADYLDAETARIDALIEKKKEMLALISKRANAEAEEAVRALARRWGEVPLKYLAESITVGIVVTPAAWYVEDKGVPALRGLNVTQGRLLLDDLVNISLEGHALHAKSALRAGDVVVVRTGQAGSAAVVPAELAGANCIDLIRIRPSARLDSEFLQFVLNCDWTQKHIAEHSVGTIQSHFNVGAMNGLPVPNAPKDAQELAARSLRAVMSRCQGLRSPLGRQIGLLVEHRQALITAAVTGELDVPGAA